MQIDIVNIAGKKVGQADLADAVFGAKVKDYLLWEMVKAQQAAKRAGTHKTKKRDEVRGGGKKPYKQKGTGNARQGSSRSPQFVGGGTVWGPQPRDYSYTVPKKVKRAAPRLDRLAFVDELVGMAVRVEVGEDVRVVAKDPKDDKYVTAALAARAEFVVSFDRRHLVAIGEYEKVRFVTPGDFLAALRSSTS